MDLRDEVVLRAFGLVDRLGLAGVRGSPTVRAYRSAELSGHRRAGPIECASHAGTSRSSASRRATDIRLVSTTAAALTSKAAAHGDGR